MKWYVEPSRVHWIEVARAKRVGVGERRRRARVLPVRAPRMPVGLGEVISFGV